MSGGALAGVRVEGPQGPYLLACDALVLAPGHSARDTFAMLHGAGVPMEQKGFAVGLRIEHRQRDVSFRQYGGCWEKLPPSPATCPLAAPHSPSVSVPGDRWWPPPRNRGAWSPTA